ncbi:DUF302 domain-containing protein [Chitinophaga polysaccharea]|uniref:DUF302 domain-containing protein n=1 Tax=Chitinophaga TaxID=79328 RepID=UPI001455D29A|nr:MULTISPECIES: DUF302 domain-containing protein [Chitinophaga]NLR57495.1 DUF302 domain-containing protein [Chitinophaga polysaccharea]NLU95409.1 DUF302 domain-containing protein [Chitinophaga sp. Ak27]
MDSQLCKTVALSFSQAIEKITDALKSEGFGVLTTIDVKDTLKKKIDVNFRDYIILGACNPQLAYQALSADGKIGLLLPCNVVIQQYDDGKVEICIADPEEMARQSNNNSLTTIAATAKLSLSRVLQKV